MANLRERLKDRLKGLGGPSDALERQMSGLLERATSEMWISPDWGLNMELVDLVNTHQGAPTYEKLFRVIRRRLARSNPKVQLLVLTVLETCVKNCGARMHAALASSDLWGDVVRLGDPKRRVDLEVQDRVLVMVEDFAHSLRPHEFQRAVLDLRDAGVRFPERPAGEIGLGIDPEPTAAAQAVGGVTEADQAAIQEALRDLERAETARRSGGAPGGQPPAVLASAPAGPAQEDLELARNAVDLFVEALDSIPPSDLGAVRQEFIADLASQCEGARPRLMRVINGAGDGDDLGTALAVMDDLNRAHARYEELRQSADAPRDAPAQSAPGLLPALVTDHTVAEHQQRGRAPAAAPDVLSGLAASPTSADSSSTAHDAFSMLAAEGVGRPAPVGVRPRQVVADGFDELVIARSPTARGGPQPGSPPRLQPPPQQQPAPDQTGDLISL
ncbi:unnamed protein product [Ostreobium quekettii]|uniref:VHS domain-containing protein n=1 Tax=Ostreobium quekettii TaxID=121088 RepID=A0A8S1ISS1_9CHLO|nr:unnamed protein product [Ostreobium quekettii]|eukprot:evm.model.scf_124.10 EVM.evm.TU.scf_124.10   scf_124:138854-140188(+)